MYTYFIVVEIITVNFSSPEEIDVELDTFDVVACDEQSAVEALKEQINYHTEWGARGINQLQVCGRLEDETF